MKRITFVVAGIVAVFIVLFFIKPDQNNKTEVKKNNIVYHKTKAAKVFN